MSNRLFGWTLSDSPYVPWEFMKTSDSATAGIVSHRGANGSPTWFACNILVKEESVLL